MNKHIFIAGKTEDEDRELCKAKFEQAELKLRNAGVFPVNPFKLGIPSHLSFYESKQHYFKAIHHCAAIFMLKDYEESAVALTQLNEAQRLGLDVFHETNDGYENVFRAVAS